jgi:competence protein ComEC
MKTKIFEKIGVLLIFVLFCNSLFSNELIVTHLNIGQGDATVIQFPNGRVLQMDSGKKGRGKSIISKFYKKNNIKKIDIAIASHPDYDHIGGFKYIFDNFKITEFWENSITTTKTYKNMLLAIRKNDIKYYFGYDMIKTHLEKLNKENFFGENVTIKLLGPLKQFANNNDKSLVIQIIYKNRTFLIAGDAGYEPQQLMAKKWKETLKSDFLLVPHHGSSHNYNKYFLNYVNPEIAVISAGYKNSYHHPTDNIIKAYYAAGVKLFRTDILQSHVQIITDGQAYYLNLIPFKQTRKYFNLE